MATTSESQATTAEVTTTTATLVDGEDAEELPDASRQEDVTTPAAPENRVTTPYVSKCRCPIAPSRGLAWAWGCGRGRAMSSSLSLLLL